MLFSCLYRSPSQGRQEFESSCTKFDLFLSNINDLSLACSIITGDFRAILKKIWCYKGHTDKNVKQVGCYVVETF